MADQQRYSEEEVYSILREAVRIPGSEAQSGFTRDQIARFAADAGISEEALEQSLAKHKGRRRAKLLEYSRKTTLTLDWELSQAEINGIAGLCEALPPYAYKSMGNYATIRIDQWGFYSIVSILRNDGFTHISIDRGANLELLSGVFAFCALFFVSIFMLSAQRTTYDLNGNPVANSLEMGPLVLGVAVLLLIFVAGFIGSRISTAKRRKLAELIASDVKASLID
jgi:hypothetical protein